MYRITLSAFKCIRRYQMFSMTKNRELDELQSSSKILADVRVKHGAGLPYTHKITKCHSLWLKVKYSHLPTIFFFKHKFVTDTQVK